MKMKNKKLYIIRPPNAHHIFAICDYCGKGYRPKVNNVFCCNNAECRKEYNRRYNQICKIKYNENLKIKGAIEKTLKESEEKEREEKERKERIKNDKQWLKL